MRIARTSVAGWAVVATVVGAATAAGCASGKTPSPSPSASSAGAGSVTSPSSGQPVDYSALLISATDVGGDFTAPQPPVLNPNNADGVAQFFVNADKSRRIGDSIQIEADAATAATGVDNTKANYGSRVSGPWQPLDVGSNGAMNSGTSPDNSQAVTVLLFTEGKALVDLEFDSAPNDPIDVGVAIDVARKQDAAIKKGLHN
jgi:hypothetical protein